MFAKVAHDSFYISITVLYGSSVSWHQTHPVYWRANKKSYDEKLVGLEWESVLKVDKLPDKPPAGAPGAKPPASDPVKDVTKEKEPKG